MADQNEKLGRKNRATVIDSPEIPSTAELRSTTRLLKSGPDFDKEGKDGLPNKHSFEVRYEDKQRGLVWEGSFKAHVLTVNNQIQLAIVKSRLLNGVSPLSVDLDTGMLVDMIAHLTVALDDAPPWAKELTAIYDPQVLAAIYKEVIEYEGRFRGAVTP